MSRPASNRSRALLAALALCLPLAPAQALPSTFGPVIGSALLCRSHLDNAYFHSWLEAAFGPSYKHEGGAYWFKAPDATLWGTPVSEIIVSDDTSPLVFVGAVAESTPEQLEQSIHAAAGMRYLAADGSRYPLRVSNPGSTIAYFNAKSKIYCARFKPLPPGR
ncbi:MAG: hypothetical protein ACJ8LG_11610 [Massilia sp.]